MKRLVCSALFIGATATSMNVYASKARMEALGQGAERGSDFISDTRNIFGNPADVNDLKNYIITEWGSANNSSDSSTTPHAEGGFFKDFGQNLAYGVYLGSEINAQNANRTVDFNNDSTNDVSFQNYDNAVNLFLAGDMGTKWGVNLSFAKSENGSATDYNSATHEIKHSAFGVGFGVSMGELAASINLDIKDESEGSNQESTNFGRNSDKFEADLGTNLGVSYAFGDFTLYTGYARTGFTATGSDGTTEYKKTGSETSLHAGVGHTQNVSSSSKVFIDGNIAKSTTVANAAKTVVTSMPLTVAFETDANSWLALRGSVKQNIIIGATKNNAGKKTTTANSTDVAAGATLKFGSLKVDGVIGTTDHNRAATSSAEKGTLTLDNLMTRVSVHYWF